ncbi:hypothetical protein CYL16_18265 [Mycobacterium sp. EPG1]|nr:hypothetical protein CYL16_18265 [Mycobacterium sp. EPG1]
MAQPAIGRIRRTACTEAASRRGARATSTVVMNSVYARALATRVDPYRSLTATYKLLTPH